MIREISDKIIREINNNRNVNKKSLSQEIKKKFE